MRRQTHTPYTRHKGMQELLTLFSVTRYAGALPEVRFTTEPSSPPTAGSSHLVITQPLQALEPEAKERVDVVRLMVAPDEVNLLRELDLERQQQADGLEAVGSPVGSEHTRAPPDTTAGPSFNTPMRPRLIARQYYTPKLICPFFPSTRTCPHNLPGTGSQCM